MGCIKIDEAKKELKKECDDMREEIKKGNKEVLTSEELFKIMISTKLNKEADIK